MKIITTRVHSKKIVHKSEQGVCEPMMCDRKIIPPIINEIVHKSLFNEIQYHVK